MSRANFICGASMSDIFGRTPADKGEEEDPSVYSLSKAWASRRNQILTPISSAWFDRVLPIGEEPQPLPRFLTFLAAEKLISWKTKTPTQRTAQQSQPLPVQQQPLSATSSIMPYNKRPATKYAGARRPFKRPRRATPVASKDRQQASKFVKECMLKAQSLSRERITEWKTTSGAVWNAILPALNTGLNLGGPNLPSNIVSPATGVSYRERTGHSIKLKSLAIKGHFAQTVLTDVPTIGRVLVVYDKQPPGTTTRPSIDDVLQTPNDAFNSLSVRKNEDFKDRFQILHDEQHMLRTTGQGPTSKGYYPININLSWKNGKQVLFKVATGTDSLAEIEMGAIYIYYYHCLQSGALSASGEFNCIATAKFQA